MRNPSDYTLSEIECALRQYEQPELENAVLNLKMFIRQHEENARSYQVKAAVEAVQRARTHASAPTRRTCTSLDGDLLDACIVIEG